MSEQPVKIAKVDWDKFQLEVQEPKTWVQLISQFHGRELAILGITGIAITYILMTRSDLVSVPLAAIVSVLVLGLTGLSWRKQGNDATSHTLRSKNKT